MAVNWPAAKTEGSPVKNYNLEISPPPANGVAVKNGVTGLSYTWPGLTNGVKYKVRAQAVNELGPSDWSAYSRRGQPGRRRRGTGRADDVGRLLRGHAQPAQGGLE